jgi:peroxiredoxin family protein
MDQKKLAIIATKGTLDWAYPPLILASTAAALGYDVEVFCTFYGLQLLRKDTEKYFSASRNGTRIGNSSPCTTSLLYRRTF